MVSAQVALALRWAGWKTYLSDPEDSFARCNAMNSLGGGLVSIRTTDLSAHRSNVLAGLSVLEAHLAFLRRDRPHAREAALSCQTNIANAHSRLGRQAEALRARREVFAGQLAFRGATHERTFLYANNMSIQLYECRLWNEARQFAREWHEAAQRVMGNRHRVSIKAKGLLAMVLANSPGASRADVIEAEALFGDASKMAQNVYGPHNPQTEQLTGQLADTRRMLAARGSE